MPAESFVKLLVHVLAYVLAACRGLECNVADMVHGGVEDVRRCGLHGELPGVQCSGKHPSLKSKALCINAQTVMQPFANERATDIVLDGVVRRCTASQYTAPDPAAEHPHAAVRCPSIEKSSQ